MSVVGGAMIVAGAALTGEGRLRGIAGVAVGLGCLASIPWYLAPTGRARPAAGGVDGRPEAGLVFRYSTTGTRVATAGLGFFTIAMAALAVWPGELAPGEPAARALGIVGALLTGTMFLVGLASSVRGGPWR